MANKNAKSSKNVKGKFYVDNTCIGCGLCVNSLPDFFAEDSSSGMMCVYKQPSNASEIAECQEILNNCPVNAIGDDGE